MLIITDTIHVRAITSFIIPFQSGGALFMTGTHYKHRVLYTQKDDHRYLFTLDDRIAM